jgi:hypothetical protein
MDGTRGVRVKNLARKRYSDAADDEQWKKYFDGLNLNYKNILVKKLERKPGMEALLGRIKRKQGNHEESV